MNKGKRFKNKKKINKMKVMLFISLIIIFLLIFQKIFVENTKNTYFEIEEFEIKLENKEITENEETEDENVKTYIENKMETENLTNENFAFFYYNEDTKKYYFYNEKKWFTAASTSKVPIAMLYYDKLNEGEITKNSTYKYESGTYEVGDGLTAYKYDVGDYIPVSFLLEQMIVNSDNK